jgi:tetratricopeptide (TPR) repeat protein
MAFIGRRKGRWEEAISGLQGALCLDPRHPGILGSLGNTYCWLRRYRDVEQIYDRQIEFAPNKNSLKAYKASMAFEEKADLESYQAVVEKLPSATRNNLWITSLRFQMPCLPAIGGMQERSSVMVRITSFTFVFLLIPGPTQWFPAVVTKSGALLFSEGIQQWRPGSGRLVTS